MSEPILIATIMRPDGVTGVQTHFRAFSSYLADHGHSTQLITPFNLQQWQVYPVFAVRKLIDLFNGSLSVWWYRYWHAMFLKIALQHAVTNDKSCVIYAQCPLSADAALRARLSNKQRVVMVVHFNISQAEEWVEKGKISVGSPLFESIRLFESEVLPNLDGLVFVSEFMRLELIKRIPAIEKVPFRVIPNFLRDPGLAHNSATPARDLVCIGTLEPRKNQRYAIEIVAAAKSINRTLTLTIVGDGPSRSELELLCQQLGVSDQVKFTGFVKNGSTLLSQHRACIHVAQIENLPLTLIEALAYGKPVFAPAVGGIPEVFSDEVEGKVIPLNDAKAAAQLIGAWLDSDNMMKEAGIAARERYLSSFEETVIARKLLDFLRN